MKAFDDRKRLPRGILRNFKIEGDIDSGRTDFAGHSHIAYKSLEFVHI
jgi:hypothetical protein